MVNVNIKIVFIVIVAFFMLSISFFAFADLMQPVPRKMFDNDLLAYWRFNEINQSMIIDHSGNGYHGTIYGDPTWSEGKIDGSLTFDGSGDYVSITGNNTELFSTLSQLGQGSISVWFRVDTIPTENGIMPIFYYGSSSPCTHFFDAANQGLIIEVGHSPIHYGSKRIYFTIWANGCTYPSFCYDSRDPLSEETWYHFVAVVGPNYNTGYLNGEELVNRRYNFGNNRYSQFFEDAVVDEALWFGRGYWNAREDASPVYFDGAIDDIRIYTNPLSDQQVNAIYREGTENLAPQTPSIKGPSQGKPDIVYDYILSTMDPEGDDVFYAINWNDDSDNLTLGPYTSGEPVSVNHSWQKYGDYSITVKAIDQFGAESDQMNLQVSIPKAKEYPIFNGIIQYILRLLRFDAPIQ